MALQHLKKMLGDIPAVIPLIIASLLLGALPKMPGGYYDLLRIVVSVFAGFISYRGFSNQDIGLKSLWPWFFAFIAILFNPIIHVKLGKELWSIIDVSFSLFFLWIAYMIYKK